MYYSVTLGQYTYTNRIQNKDQVMTEIYPSSALMGIGIASTIVPHVRNDYDNSQSWSKADSPLDVLACLHRTVR